MFGYVKPDKAELKIKEYETYKAVYCSLCKTLGKEYGLFSRFFLTYDATFFVLFFKSVFQTSPDCAHKGVCRFNPLKKCNYISEDEFFKKAAALTVIMFYYKLRDTLSDGTFLKKIITYFIYPYIKIKFNKAARNYSQYNDIIKLQMERQTEIEQSDTDSVDLACDPSAKALSDIFSLDAENPELANPIKRTAYCVGRWVYLMDAFDDLEADVKSGAYNPFIAYYSIKNTEDISEGITKEIIGRIRLTANEAAVSFEDINKSCYRTVVENIIFDGMENELNILINKKKKRGEKLGK